MLKTRPAQSSPQQPRHGTDGAAPDTSPTPDAFIIDDEEGICSFVSMTLGTLGLVAQSFHVAGDAVAALERGHPEIVFLDIALGQSDAVENASFDVLTRLDVAAIARQNRPRSETWAGLIVGVGENEVIDDLQLAHEVATQLRIYDITLAINNFGAGYSPLERLRELPFSELKLHPGFVEGCAQDTRSAGVCKAAIDLAHRFGATAIATGLENDADLGALQRMGCDAAQGPLLAEPWFT